MMNKLQQLIVGCAGLWVLPVAAHTGDHHAEGIYDAVAHVLTSGDHWLVFSVMGLVAFGVSQRRRLLRIGQRSYRRMVRHSETR